MYFSVSAEGWPLGDGMSYGLANSKKNKGQPTTSHLLPAATPAAEKNTHGPSLVFYLPFVFF